MPSATATKRVKGKRIERAYIIGSEAWPLDETGTRKPDTPPEHTKGWRVYVKVPEGQPPITTWLRKVQFKIFHTYANPTRMIEEPPFQIEETGWGGFTVEIKLFFIAEVGSRPQDRSHFLQLEKYGDEVEQQRQAEERLVRSEQLDFVEFNEPTEALFETLTDEAQFKVKGRGKGKVVKREEGENTVELQQSGTIDNPYSKDLEQTNLQVLKRALAKLEELNTAEDAKLRRIREDRSKLIGS